MLSSTATYALRALVGLARAGVDGVTGQSLAAETGVPATYLAKILLALKSAGIVKASRGVGGGYQLQREARSVRLIEIVELFDHERSRPRCFLSSEEECNDASACTAHHHWKSVREAYFGFLENTSVSDIALAKPARRRRAAPPP